MSLDLFRSTNLIYRAVETGDEKFLHTILSDSLAQQNAGAHIKPVSKKGVQEWMTFLIDKTVLGVVICLPAKPVDQKDAKETGDGNLGEPIPFGVISLYSGEANALTLPNSGHANLAVELLDGYRGKGYGTEAIKWICNWAFESAHMHSIGIGCFAYNEGARRLYDSMGFVYQGRIRDHVWMNGAYHDSIEFSLLENEFKELKDKGLW